IGPTMAQVSLAGAAPAQTGGVDVQWASATEVNNIGYRVLRAASAAGPFKPVSPGLINSMDRPAGGSIYHFNDPSGTAQDWYQIEAVDSHNIPQRCPPFA